MPTTLPNSSLSWDDLADRPNLGSGFGDFGEAATDAIRGLESQDEMASNGADHAELVSERGSGAATLVWRRVLEGIYEGRYLPGQRLTEADLTQEFAVGRSSVREALTRLAAEGAVTLQRYKGAIVRAKSRSELLETLEVLDSLIALSARLAARNIDQPGARARATEELRHLASGRESYSAFELARERNRFYRTLLALAANKELRRLMSYVHVHPLRVQLGSSRPPSAVFSDYIGILAAVLAGDAPRAEEAAHAHVAANIAEIEALFEEDAALLA